MSLFKANNHLQRIFCSRYKHATLGTGCGGRNSCSTRYNHDNLLHCLQDEGMCEVLLVVPRSTGNPLMDLTPVPDNNV